jgi:hypothetical protein
MNSNRRSRFWNFCRCPLEEPAHGDGPPSQRLLNPLNMAVLPWRARCGRVISDPDFANA